MSGVGHINRLINKRSYKGMLLVYMKFRNNIHLVFLDQIGFLRKFDFFSDFYLPNEAYDQIMAKRIENWYLEPIGYHNFFRVLVEKMI